MIEKVYKSALTRFHVLYVFLFTVLLIRSILAFLFYLLLVIPGFVDFGRLLPIGILESVIGAVSSWLLLCGKRIGLWLFLLVLVITTFAGGIERLADWSYDVKIFVGICSLYLIIFWLKKDGLSAWKVLS